MKNNKRFLLGLVSSLLLTCGFVRAAERLDPINSVSAASLTTARDVAPNCTFPCNIDDNGR